MTCPHVTAVDTLDWPSSFLETTTVLSGGNAVLDYELRRLQLRSIRHGSSFLSTDASSNASSEDETDEQQRDLLALSPLEMEELTYYQVLEIPIHASQQTIKKAYHKACLLYHPDKTGRSEEDAVFLTIKAAFDTLSDNDKRMAYDSTSLTFNDAIPSGKESREEFFETYGPVFQENLRFDAQLRRNATHKPPVLGTDDTPLEQVHAFYDYWIHFESWRDFSLKASEETKHDVEMADSRYEKRWMQKEISRKSKAMKRQEVARLALLVERSMAADPRLQRERQRVAQEKVQRKRRQVEEQEEEEKRKQLAQEELKLAHDLKEREEREQKVAAKAIREREKKQLRKTRQAFRKLTMNAYDDQTQDNTNKVRVWKDLEEMNDDLELLCTKLTEVQLSKLTNELEQTSDNTVLLKQVQHHAAQTRAGISEEEIQARRQREEARAALEKKEALQKASRASAPWTKEELSTLAKAIKKYPAGGANRWETITLFINNICKPDTPRTKEECIEKYNQIAKQTSGGTVAAAASSTSNGDGSATTTTANSDVWTEQQDQQLQDGLKKYPGTMDKNERWTSIAKGVNGKSKKECVQRFKAIRAALKNK